VDVSGELLYAYSQTPSEYKSGWVLEPVWTLWTTKKMESRSCCPDCGPVVQTAVLLPRPRSCSPDRGPVAQTAILLSRPRSCCPDCGPVAQTAILLSRPRSCCPDRGPVAQTAILLPRPRSCCPDRGPPAYAPGNNRLKMVANHTIKAEVNRKVRRRLYAYIWTVLRACVNWLYYKNYSRFVPVT